MLYNYLYKKKLTTSIGISLFSHPVARALSSAPQSLTSVFGMGTGGPSASSTPTIDLIFGRTPSANQALYQNSRSCSRQMVTRAGIEPALPA